MELVQLFSGNPPALIGTHPLPDGRTWRAKYACPNVGGIDCDFSLRVHVICRPFVAGWDGDGDGVEDRNDNCPYDANSGQEDADADSRGDVCDLSDATFEVSCEVTECELERDGALAQCDVNYAADTEFCFRNTLCMEKAEANRNSCIEDADATYALCTEQCAPTGGGPL